MPSDDRSGNLAPGELLGLYRTMLTIRRFEERVTREFRRGKIPGFVHSYAGSEAIAVGVCAHLDDADMITSTHRGHGHCIAKGCDLRAMFAEVAGRVDGLCRGRGGSMHVADFSKGMLGANAIVGGGIGIATGAALAAQCSGSRAVAVAFFGDGAANQGVLHESMNLASIWRLPIVYVCENNGWAESTPASYASSIVRLADRAAGYAMEGVTVDAASVVDVHRAAGAAIERARAGSGPTFLEVTTRRFEGHFVGDPAKYRNEDVAELRISDPIADARSLLLSSGLFTDGDLQALESAVDVSIDQAADWALESEWPDPESVERDVYAPTGVVQ